MHFQRSYNSLRYCALEVYVFEEFERDLTLAT